MLGLKLAGALLLTLSGIMGARVLNSSASASLAQTEGLIAFIKWTRVQIDCFCHPISKILENASQELLLSCGFFGGERPKSLAEFTRRCSVKDKGSFEIFCAFSSEFGRGYRAEQLRACDYYTALLEERRQNMASKLPAQRKKNSSLCVCFALALAILLI